jgi:hypothetical protein
MPGSGFPIQEQQIGAIAYLEGILNDGTAISMTGIANFELDSDDLTLNWNEKENKDTQGNVQNIVQKNFRYERAIKFSPSGSTRAAAAAVVDAVFTLVSLTVAHHKVAAFNGAWRVKPGIKASLKMDDNASIDIQAEKYVNAAQNSALNSTPIVG